MWLVSVCVCVIPAWSGCRQICTHTGCHLYQLSAHSCRESCSYCICHTTKHQRLRRAGKDRPDCAQACMLGFRLDVVMAQCWLLESTCTRKTACFCGCDLAQCCGHCKAACTCKSACFCGFDLAWCGVVATADCKSCLHFACFCGCDFSMV